MFSLLFQTSQDHVTVKNARSTRSKPWHSTGAWCRAREAPVARLPASTPTIGSLPGHVTSTLSIIGHALLWGRPRPAPEDWPVEEEEEEGSSELDLVLIFLQALWPNTPSEH